MSFITGDTIHLTIAEPFYKARNFVNWDIEKYGDSEIGTSIDIDLITNIKKIILTINSDNTILQTTKEKIKEYVYDTPNSLTTKFNKEVIIVPLSIFKKVDNTIEIDINEINIK